ncbi:MAG: hypothetical protein KAT28_05100 [Candidatus Aenigmarchaeota archaeon]|nr:hypothetical protein [Candidatus Aenigmarchaeota archaeon]
MKIPYERKIFIDEVIEDLYKEYYITDFNDLRQIAEDKDINTIESNKVIVPSAIRLLNDKKYILTRNYPFRDMRDYFYSHELGHILLDHEPSMSKKQKESEVEYFQKKLGVPEPTLFKIDLSVLHTIITRPITTVKYISSTDYKWNYCEKLINDFETQ